MIRALRQAASFASRACGLVFLYYLPVSWHWLCLRARPRNYVRSVTPGGLRHANGRWAILVVWQPARMAWFVDGLIDAMARQKINLLVVANALPGDTIPPGLLARCATVMQRDNQGFDFGGYRDGYAHLMAEERPERLLIANDSVIYYPEGLDELLARLMPEADGADVISAFENIEGETHFQSFMFSLSGAVLNSPVVRDYWRDYVPISNRRWCIQRGEFALSRALRRVGRSFEVVASGQALAEALTRLHPSELLSIRREMAVTLRDGWKELEDLAARASIEGPGRHHAHEELALAVVKACQRQSPPHCAPFLYARLLGIRLIKRDLLWRDRYSLTELEWHLRRSGMDDHLAEVLAEFRRRGRGCELRGVQRARFVAGVI